jgi:aryl-alcohol dehydrogenase-like predicted oxidoreductase
MEKRRLGRTGQMSSILIFGSFALYRISQKEADAVIEMALANGINQVDVSPLYGDAEKHLGSWFQRHGKQFFLSCKTAERKKKGAWESLQRSLETLHIDKFDIFQLHGVDDINVLKTTLDPGGAMEAVLEAKAQGLVRFIGITGHNPPLHNQALQLFDFDTVMFPLNRVHAVHPTDWNDFGLLLKTARQKDAGVMAIKSIAKQAWENEEMRSHHDTWYEPFTDAEEIEKSLQYTLSQNIAAAVLPGELSIWPKMIEVAQNFKPMTAQEQQDAMAGVKQYQPLVGPQMD